MTQQLLSPTIKPFYPVQEYYDHLNAPRLRQTTTSLHFASSLRLLSGTADGQVRAYNVYAGEEDGTIIGELGDMMINGIVEITGKVFVGSSEGVGIVKEGDVYESFYEGNVGRGGLVLGNGNMLWVGEAERLLLIDGKSRKVVETWDGSVYGLDFVNEGNGVVCSCGNGEVQVVDRREKTGAAQKYLVDGGENVEHVACDPDGNFVLCASKRIGREWTLTLVYLGSGQVMWRKSVGLKVQCIRYRRGEFLVGGVEEILGSGDEGVLRMDMEGHVIGRLKGNLDDVLAIDVESIAGRVAVGGYTRRRGWQDCPQVIDYYVQPPLLSSSLLT